MLGVSECCEVSLKDKDRDLRKGERPCVSVWFGSLRSIWVDPPAQSQVGVYFFTFSFVLLEDSIMMSEFLKYIARGSQYPYILNLFSSNSEGDETSAWGGAHPPESLYSASQETISHFNMHPAPVA